MCYSAMVEQSLKRLGITFQARIQLDLFEELFRRRLVEEQLKIPKALEAEFMEPDSELEARIHAHIVEFRRRMNDKYAVELARQRERLLQAERRLSVRSTKSALEDRRISSTKIAWLLDKLESLTRVALVAQDSRIFPFHYAPVVVEEQGERWIRPMRYHCRGQGKPAENDARYPGLYNARRDNLDGFWRHQFGTTHGVMLVNAFYENVSRHVYEHRTLAPGERDESWVVEYRPQRSRPLTIACLWDEWQGEGTERLLSFAAITDIPPADIAETGHDRCVVALKEEYVSAWLAPHSRTDAELHYFLSERDSVPYSHRKAS